MNTLQKTAEIDGETQHRVERFLYREADLLDTFALDDWLSLLDEEILLKIPVRTARDPGSERSEFSSDSYYMYEDYEMLRERIGRLEKEYAWSENPRSRVRHVIGNVAVQDTDGDELVVSNNQLVYRSYGDTPDNDLLSGKRETVLTESADGFRIKERTVYMDHTVLNTKNLTLPLL